MNGTQFGGWATGKLLRAGNDKSETLTAAEIQLRSPPSWDAVAA
jgi:hypothetical protein